MSWEIRVWHEQIGDRMRLAIEAGPDVPDEVISSIVSAYWYEHIQVEQETWEGNEEYEGDAEPSPRFHG